MIPNKELRKLCEENGVKFQTVKSRLNRGLPLELALLQNPYDFVPKKEREVIALDPNKKMRYWIVKNHKITVEER